MATATQPTPAAVETNTTAERSDIVVGYDLAAGKDDKNNDIVKRTEAFYSVTTDDEVTAVKKLVEENKFQKSFEVTVSIPRAKNLAGIKEICPDEEEAAANFNRGAKQKANNRLKAKLLDIGPDGNFTFNPETDLTNGVLDMTAEIASPSKRKVLSEEEKLDRFLEQFPEVVRNQMKAAYLAARQPVAA